MWPQISSKYLGSVWVARNKIRKLAKPEIILGTVYLRGILPGFILLKGTELLKISLA